MPKDENKIDTKFSDVFSDDEKKTLLQIMAGISENTNEQDLEKNNNTEQNNKTSISSINLNSIIMAVLTLISRLLGFIRIGVLSALFGTSGTADILNLVLSIPNNLRKLLAEGALFNAYMPSYTQSIGSSTQSTIKSRMLLSEVVFYIGIVTLAFVGILSVFSNYVTQLLFHFSSESDAQLGARLFSYVIYFLFLMSMAAMLSGMLQAHKKFLLPALSPTIMSIVTISSMLLLYKISGIFAVVYGYLLGGLLQVVCMAIPLLMMGYRLQIISRLKNVFQKKSRSPEFNAIIKRIPLIALAVIFPMIGQQITFYLASRLPEGSASAFSYAIVFWQLPIGVIINSIVGVSFSYLLTMLTKKDIYGVRTCISNAVEKLALFLVPVSIMFLFFSFAGISVTLQRGNMSVESSILTARVLNGYSMSLFPMGMYLFFQKVFLAYQKNYTVFLYSLCFTIVDVALSVFLVSTQLAVVGISLAYTLTLFIFVPIMNFHVKLLTGYKFPKIKTVFVLLANLPLILFSYFLSKFTYKFWIEGSTLINLLMFIVLSIVLLTIIILGYRIVGIHIIGVIKGLKNEK